MTSWKVVAITLTHNLAIVIITTHTCDCNLFQHIVSGDNIVHVQFKFIACKQVGTRFSCTSDSVRNKMGGKNREPN